MSNSSAIECQGLRILDIPYYHPCFNGTDTETQVQCEIEYPCEVRQFLHSISLFISITRGLLSYGTVVIIVLGLFLNSLSFYILISSGLTKTGTGIYLLSLSVCDIGNLILNYAVGIGRGHVTDFNYYFMDKEWLCRFHAVFVEVFQLISAWIVVSFTVERCIAIWFPMLLTNSSRKKRARTVVISLSIVLTLFSLTKLFLTGFEDDSVFGYPACYSRRYRWQGVAYVRVAFQTWIPTVTVFVFNSLMFCKLEQAKRRRKHLTEFKHASPKKAKGFLEEGQRKPSFLTRPSRTAPMLVAVSLTYLVLVFPLGIVQTVELLWNIHHKSPFHPGYVRWMTTKLLLKYIRCFCFGFYQMNFAINFFLYFAAGLQFRLHLQQKFIQFFGSYCGCKDETPTSEFQEVPSATGTVSTIVQTSSKTASISRTHSNGSTLPQQTSSERQQRRVTIAELEATHRDIEAAGAHNEVSEDAIISSLEIDTFCHDSRSPEETEEEECEGCSQSSPQKSQSPRDPLRTTKSRTSSSSVENLNSSVRSNGTNL